MKRLYFIRTNAYDAVIADSEESDLRYIATDSDINIPDVRSTEEAEEFLSSIECCEEFKFTIKTVYELLDEFDGDYQILAEIETDIYE